MATLLVPIALLCLLQGCAIFGGPEFRESMGDLNTAAMVQLDQLHHDAYVYAGEHRTAPANLNTFTARRPGVRVDPWGREIIYRVLGTTFELRSTGADGIEASGDDIVIWGIAGHRDACRLRHGDGLIVDPTNAPPACTELRRRVGSATPASQRR